MFTIINNIYEREEFLGLILACNSLVVMQICEILFIFFGIVFNIPFKMGDKKRRNLSLSFTIELAFLF